MSGAKLFSMTVQESADTTLARTRLLDSLRDREYRHEFVKERVRGSIALQIRALREQREMTQAGLGSLLDMAQTWVSKLENPDYGKMTVATLLRLAEAFDTDLEIKFRPFSTTIDRLPRQGPEYFTVPNFDEEFGEVPMSEADNQKARNIIDWLERVTRQIDSDKAHDLGLGLKSSQLGSRDEPPSRIPMGIEPTTQGVVFAHR